VLCAVSKEFREAAEGDALWRQAYNTRFPKKSEVCGNTEQGGPDAGAGGCSGVSGGGDDGEDYDDGDGGGDGDGDDDDHTATTAARSRESGAQQPAGVKVAGFKHRYKRRLQDPHVSAVRRVKRGMRCRPAVHENPVVAWMVKGVCVQSSSFSPHILKSLETETFDAERFSEL